MDFELNEEEAMVKSMAREFAEKEIEPFSRDWNRNGEFPVEVFRTDHPPVHGC